MATGGMGDVLTGICAALMGQKLGPWDAARPCRVVPARAGGGPRAGAGSESEESLLPTDLFPLLGTVFKELRRV